MSIITVERCTAKPCGALVSVTIDGNGGLPMAVNGYSGVTDDGDPVCSDHFCPICGNFHTEAAQFERCAFYGVRHLNLDPPCSRDVALATLAHHHA